MQHLEDYPFSLAKRFFSLAVKQHGAPRVITLDGYAASHRAVDKLVHETCIFDSLPMMGHGRFIPEKEPSGCWQQPSRVS